LTTPSRRLACRILISSEAGPARLAELLDAPEANALPERERALLHELVLGTLRSQGFIDHALSPLLRRPLFRLAPAVRAALRLGAHQLLAMRVPDHAAVSESVGLVGGPARSLVNAVLRRLSREGPSAAPAPDTDPLGWLTTAGSLPRWLAGRWLQQLGAERAVARAQALLRPPPSVFRLNPRRPEAAAELEAAGIRWRPLGLPGAALLVEGRLAPAASAMLLAQQAEGSQLVAHLAAADGRVLDLCAAPGGKARLIADLLAPTGRVVAMEASPRRLDSLVRLTRAWRAQNVDCVAGDGIRPPFACVFDSVLLDAPCSGTGTLARCPDIRWRLTPRALARHPARQMALLGAAAELVRPGGQLVYSTCSLEPEENDQAVAAFLERRPEFALQEPPAWAGAFEDGRFLRCLPERHPGEGFFVALLRRKPGRNRS
jgi:16S rRNA (cytosine967-C5)-methyltransferase